MAICLEAEGILDFIVAYSVVHKLGAVSVPVNNRLSPPEIRAILGHAEVSAIITSAAYEEAVAPLVVLLGSLALVATVVPSGRAGFTAIEEVKSIDDSAIQTPIGDEGPRRRHVHVGDYRQPRREWWSVTATSPSLPNSLPTVEGNRVAHRDTGVHVRRAGVHLQPDEGGDDGPLPSPLRRRSLARHRWRPSTRLSPSSCRPWRDC